MMNETSNNIRQIFKAIENARFIEKQVDYDRGWDEGHGRGWDIGLEEGKAREF